MGDDEIEGILAQAGTMRQYLEKTRAEERRSPEKEDACSYDVDFAEECIKVHMDAFEAWPYGNVKKIEVDGDGDLRITYAGRHVLALQKGNWRDHMVVGVHDR